ncbi:FG-GAP-like repeat-containing protein [Mucilaginibacter sp. PAMB04274]|uniref:FG-GAP-like repeat-containing protein n=1 Tax=Mucilaginibacter sp. PAMB04274 TaxID=3138568 RepID=UPI0031F69EB8
MNRIFLKLLAVALIFFVHDAISQVPVINSFSPLKGKTGSIVTIQGSNFDSTPERNIVTFGAARATVIAASANQLQVAVPPGATYQPITLVANSLAAYSSKPFLLTFDDGAALSANSFANKVDFTTASAPRNIISQDFDNDGKPDVALTYSGGFSVYLNASSVGAINFIKKADFTTGVSTPGIAAADLNGDGLAEIVVISGSNKISVLKNTSTKGAPAFAEKTDFITGASPSGIAVADLNKDGKPDIAVSHGNENTFAVLLNTSSGNTIKFDPKINFNTSRIGVSIVTGDINGDNKDDIILCKDTYPSKTLTVYENTTSAAGLSFTERANLGTASLVEHPLLADLDDDGLLDIVSPDGPYTTTRIFQNTTSGQNISFSEKLTLLTGYYPSTAACADLNGDGKVDIAVPDNVYPGVITVLANASTPNSIAFASGVGYTKTSSSQGISIADFDGDGRPDMVCSNLSNNNFSVFLNRTGSLTIDSFTPKTAGTGTTVILKGSGFAGVNNVMFGNIAAASFKVVSKDTITAIVGSGASGNISVSESLNSSYSIAGFKYISNPKITSCSPLNIKAGTRVTIEGLDLKDALAVNFGGVPAASFSVVSDTRIVATVATGASGTLTVQTAGGISSYPGLVYYPAAPVISNSSALSGPAGASLNLTGTGFNVNAASNVVMFGAVKAAVTNATATQLTVTIPAGATYGHLSVTNLSTKLTGYSTASFTPVFASLNKISSNDFSSKITFANTVQPVLSQVTDMDGDGQPDVIMLNANKTISVYLNTAANSAVTSTSYASKTDLATGNSPTSLSIADLNADGKPDIAVTNSGDNTLSVYINNSVSGNLAISNRTDYATGNRPMFCNVADIDLDGKPDIVVSNTGANSISVFRNNYQSALSSTSFVRTDFATTGMPGMIATGYLKSNEARPQIVFIQNQAVYVLVNTSEPGQLILNQQNIAVGAKALVLADFDNDNSDDLAVLSPADNIVTVVTKVYQQVLNTSYKTTLLVNANAATLNTADMDGDGKVDIVVTYSGSSILSVLKNIHPGKAAANPLFAAKVDLDAGNTPGSLTLTDGNADGKPDILVTVPQNNAWTFISNLPQPETPSLPPAISSFTPSSAGPNAVVTITGTNFNPVPNENAVYFGTIKAVVTDATATQLTVSVPIAPEYGKITVINTAANLLAVSKMPFVPLFPSNKRFTSADFNLHAEIPLGTTPASAMCTGDVDGDGKPDLIVTNSSLNTVSVYRNTSPNQSGTFLYAAKVDFATGANPQYIKLADVNLDGKLDILVANKNGNSISVLCNQVTQGTITGTSFAAKVDFEISSSPAFIEVADIDGDGKPDIATGSYPVSIFRNTFSGGQFGSSSLSSKIDFNGYGVNVLLQDLNNDGKPELINYGSGSQLRIAQNTSIPSIIQFNDAGADLYYGIAAIATGDLNADGKPDIIAAYNDTYITGSSVITFTNQSPGDNIVLNVKTSQVDGINVGNLGMADVDGDGNIDIVFSQPALNAVAVLRNAQLATGKDTLSFSGRVNLSTDATPGLIQLADLNADGKPDIITLNTKNNTLSVLINDAKMPPVISAVNPLKANVGATITISGSGFNATAANNIVYFGGVRAQVTAASAQQLSVKVPVGLSYSKVSVLNTGSSLVGYSAQAFSPTFTSKKNITSADFTNLYAFTAGSGHYAVATGDLDNNGVNDMVITMRNEHKAYVYMNKATTPYLQLSTDFEPEGVTLADVDVDGYLDIIVGNNFGGSISIYRNNLTATGEAPFQMANFRGGLAPRVLAVTDLDGDGKPEIIVANNSLSPQSIFGGGISVSVFQNLSTPGLINSNSFAPAVSFTKGIAPSSVGVADIDGDGKPDLVITNNESKIISILRNRIQNNVITTTSFEPKVDFDTGWASNSLSLDDIDGDGKVDIVVANQDENTLSIFRNTATAGVINQQSLAGKVTISTALGPVKVASADMDGDGKADLVVANLNAKTVSVFKNIAEPGAILETSFLPKVDFDIGASPVDIAIADIDNDGLLDMAVLAGPSSLIVLKNKPVADVAPVVTAFTPATGGVVAAITISGSNFDNITEVRVGTVPVSSFTVESQNSIKAVIASGASGSVLVLKKGSSGAKEGFVFIDSQPGDAPPAITSFAPSNGPVASTVTITGKNFSKTLADNTVFFGAVKATVLSADKEVLTVKVPYGATYQPISVTNNKLTAYSQKPFVTTYDGGGGNFNFTAASFATRSSFATGAKPSASFAADIDGDGKPDLITANATDGTVSVLRNTAANSIAFAQKADFAVAANPVALLAADVNGDTKLDIIAAGASGVLSILINNSTGGSITFLPKQDFKIGNHAFAIAAGDLDKDGKPDLAVTTDTDNTVEIWKNISANGSVSFQQQQKLTLSSNTRGLVIGDIDNDGKADVIVISQGDRTANFYLNTSTSGPVTFAAGIRVSIEESYYANIPENVIIGEFNGDDKLDLIISCVGNFRIMLNQGTTGNIKFAPLSYQVSSPLPNTPTSNHPALSDLDGDGIPDILLSIPVEKSVEVFRNQSTTNKTVILFPRDYPAGNNPFSINAADFDLDGRPDIAVTNLNDNTASVLKNSKVNPINITSVSPLTATAGETINITGSNFDGATAVKIGGVPVASFKLVSAAKIDAVVAAGATGDVEVTTPLGTVAYPSFTFVVKTPVISSIKNNSVAAGDTVILTGQNFFKITSVKFGKVEASSFNVVSPTTISAVVAPGSASGQVGVTNSAGTGYFDFTFLSAPVIASASTLRANTGNQINLSGENFIGVTGVQFGSSPALSYTVNSANSITAYVGTGTTGDITVKSAGGVGRFSGFVYTPPPVVLAFSPAVAGAGATVTLTGNNFDDVTAVTFGGVKATSFKIVSSTVIEAVLGTGASGNITLNSINGITSIGGFTFATPPVITSFTPQSAATAANVNITGTGFTGATEISFGGVKANYYTVNSASSITATVGAGASGDVSVTTPLGTAKLAGFVFKAPPVIAGFTPAVTGAQTQVTITGTNFTGVNAVSFGGVAAQSFTVNSPTSITATVSSAASGEVAITGVNGIAYLPGFTFVDKPVVTATGPTSFASGGKVVLSTTTNLGYTYQWNRNGVAIPGATSASYTASESGAYTVNVKAADYVTTSEAIAITVYFVLPVTNFSVATTSATCTGQADGKIAIIAAQPSNYTATLTGNTSKILSFTNTLTIDGLTAGTYNLCITVAGQDNYNQCYILIIKEPANLAVYAAVNKTLNTVNLNLNGGAQYTISVNNAVYNTSSNSIMLPLSAGSNKITVVTDKPCQGTFEQIINTSGNLKPYPNPFVNAIYINLGEKVINTTVVKIYNITNGKLEKIEKYINQSGTIQLDVTQLNAGLYSLILQRDGEELTFKMLKR